MQHNQPTNLKLLIQINNYYLFAHSHKVSCILLQYLWLSKKSIWTIDGTLISTTTPAQNEPGRNGTKLCLTIGCTLRTLLLRMQSVFSNPWHKWMHFSLGTVNHLWEQKLNLNLLIAQIHISLSCDPSLSAISLSRSSWLHPVFAQSRSVQLFASQQTLVCPNKGIQRVTKQMNSYLRLHLGPARLVRFEWFERWEASCRTVAILWGIASRIWCVAFFSKRFLRVQVVQPYSSTDTD